MTWAVVKKRPLPKPPLFTTDFFSTKSFGPGHLVGAVVLVGSLVGIAKFFIARGQATQPWPPRRPDAAPLAQAENARGHYGTTP